MIIYGKSDLNGRIGSWKGDFSIILKKDFKELFNSIKDIHFNNIEENDSVLITKDSSFPALLLSRIPDINIKRTIKEANATKVIVDDLHIPEYLPNGYMLDCVLLIDNEEINFKTLWSYEPSYDALERHIRVVRGMNYKENLNIINIEKEKVYILYYDKPTLDVAIKSPEKLVTTRKLINYISDFLPKIEESDIKSIEMLISSMDETDTKIAIELLNAYDIRDNYIKIIYLLKKYYYKISETKLHNTTGVNYLLHKLEITDSIFDLGNNDFLLNLYNNTLIDSESKKQIRSELMENLSKQIEYIYKQYSDPLKFNIILNDDN